MGFFKALGNILAGKPVYPVSGGAQQSAQPAVVGEQSPLTALTGSTVQKDIPQIRLGRIENEIRNGRYELYVDITNASQQPVFLDSIALLGSRAEPDTQMQPGDTRQFRIYTGSPLGSQPSGYAALRYRKQTDGDYFESYYEIRFKRESDGYYKVTEFRPVGPVKDI